MAEASKSTTAAAGRSPAAAPTGDRPAATDVETDSARAARELREAAARQPMSEGVRQDLLQGGGPVTDPMSGKVYTVEDLSEEDREAHRRSHAGRTDK